jgi:hypothetical protein
MFVPHRKHICGPPRPVTGIVSLSSYVDDARISQETHIWTSTACYGDSLTFTQLLLIVIVTYILGYTAGAKVISCHCLASDPGPKGPKYVRACK